MSQEAEVLTGSPAGEATPGSVLGWLRARRIASARSATSWDGSYTLLLTAGYLAAMAVVGIRDLLQQGLGLTTADPRVSLALGMAWYAGMLATAAHFGPVSAAPAAVSWLATSQLPRRQLLWPRAVVLITAALVIGAFHAVVVAGAGAAATVARAVVVGAAGGGIVAAVAIGVQTIARDPGRVLRAVAAVLLSCAGFVILIRGLDPAVEVLALTGPWGWPGYLVHHPGAERWLLAGAVAGGVVGGAGALAGLSSLRLSALATASASTAAVGAGLFGADPGMSSRVLEQGRWRRRPLRWRLPRFTGWAALVGQDLLTLSRSPGRLLTVAAAAVVPWLVAGSVSGALAGVVVWGGCGLVVAAQATTNVRHDADLPALPRLLGLPDGVIRAARMVVPAGLGGAWGAGSLALVAAADQRVSVWWVLLGLTAGPALAVGAVRAARRSFVRHDYPLIVTPMGVIPSGPILWAVQGPDVALLLLIPTGYAFAGSHAGAMAALQAAVSALGVLATVRPGPSRRRPSAALSWMRGGLDRLSMLRWRV